MLKSLLGLKEQAYCTEQVEADQKIRQFCNTVKKMEQPPEKYYRLELWASGFTDALNELEQSIFCCRTFGVHIHSHTEAAMEADEKTYYHRYLYFYKNAIIRIFSILDKLGYFMNERYDLYTEKIKHRFSYYTVLRHMEKQKRVKYLYQQLYAHKVANINTMKRLRNQRNIEIHYMNFDMINDLIRSKQQPSIHNVVEDIERDVSELHDAFKMTCAILIDVFSHASKDMR
ncbi:Cthe_2314 family HEPN domain-containing protein [Longirhabdus pacifica]|uniref:Cthe_2314 family HEPN domain-containing protein n=1 Tax=Longirhabdus pacifica TaxID=2305227 RepID=UPI00100878FB|nr:Cthe_2314 family HEPN domain-containing protein [Longirhabdus pacifica]